MLDGYRSSIIIIIYYDSRQHITRHNCKNKKTPETKN